jgi:pimeloyl-ACP methyl ester carboxylesterase
VYLNEFADDLAPMDMGASAEFASLVESATDLGIGHPAAVRYLSRQTVLRGMRFHFTEWGDPDAPPVVLLHGGNQSSHSWDLVSLHLSAGFHVYALDQRGHGDTEWSRELDYSMDSMASDLLAFIEDQQLVRPIVFGHSMGGRVTLQAVLREPTVAAAVVLVDVGPELSAKGVKVIGEFVAHNIEFDDLDVFLDHVSRYDPFRTREHISRTVKYNLLVRADGKYVSKVDHRRLPGAMSEITLGSVAAIRCPALLVRGAESDVLLADAAQRFVDALPNGRLVTVADVGHNVHGGNTAGFLAAVAPFLQEVSRVDLPSAGEARQSS